MKLKKVTFEAIGPYKDKTVIDFEQFDEQGLFLITGATGSGKTMIYDTIAYALYGKTSGQYRDAKNLKNEAAAATDIAYVELEFSHKGKDYTLLREMEHERAKKSGSGTTGVDERVVLTFDGQVIEKKKTEMNTIIQDLIGLNHSQFKQVAMIAQGEFWALLNASTDDRTKILRSIFETEQYRKLVDVLAIKKKDASDRKEQLINSILEHLADVVVEEDSTYAMKHQELLLNAQASKSVWNIDELITLIGDIVAEEEATYQQLVEQQGELAKQLDAKNQELTLQEGTNAQFALKEQCEAKKQKLEEQADDYATLKEQLARKKAASLIVSPKRIAFYKAHNSSVSNQAKIAADDQRRLELIKKFEAAQNALASAKQNEPKAQQQEEQAKRIEADLEKYIERETHRKNIADLEIEGTDIYVAKQQNDEQFETLQKEIQNLKSECEALKVSIEQKMDVDARLERTSGIMKQIHAALDAYAQYNERILELNDCKANYQKAQTAFEQARNAANQAEDLFNRNRAGLLAKKLVPGFACPVCGAKEHPAPALMTDDAISEEEVEKLRTKAEQLQQKRDSASQAYAAKQGETNVKLSTLVQSILDCVNHVSYPATYRFSEEQLQELSKATIDENQLEESIDVLSRAYDALSVEEVALTKQQEKRNQEQLQLHQKEVLLKSKDSEQLPKLLEEIELQKLNMQKIDTELAKEKAHLEALSTLEYESKEDAEQARFHLLQCAKECREEIAAREAEVKTQETALTEVKASLETLKKQQNDFDAEEEAAKKELTTTLQEQGFADLEEEMSFENTEDKLSELEQSLNVYAEEKLKAEENLRMVLEGLKGKTWNDLTVLTAARDELNAKKRDVEQTMATLSHHKQNNQAHMQAIADKKVAYQTAEKNVETARKLHNLVSGQTKGGKITFEQYIQATGFDGIIAAANRRLLPMSGGQYRLHRKTDSFSRQSANFLDLEVRDLYTNHTRPVGNLSGGESFMASLSLALGLSDTVSSNIGGIQIDALFVDEGFGTLDKTAIESAMDILKSLTSSDKLVGIISHREELLQIPQQLIVTKDDEGSHIKVQTGF